VTPFIAVLIAGFIAMLIHINLTLLTPLVFVPTLLVAFAALFVVPLAQRPPERRK
jgi:hypothetical protein